MLSFVDLLKGASPVAVNKTISVKIETFKMWWYPRFYVRAGVVVGYVRPVQCDRVPTACCVVFSMRYESWLTETGGMAARSRENSETERKKRNKDLNQQTSVARWWVHHEWWLKNTDTNLLWHKKGKVLLLPRQREYLLDIYVLLTHLICGFISDGCGSILHWYHFKKPLLFDMGYMVQ